MARNCPPLDQILDKSAPNWMQGKDENRKIEEEGRGGVRQIQTA